MTEKIKNKISQKEDCIPSSVILSSLNCEHDNKSDFCYYYSFDLLYNSSHITYGQTVEKIIWSKLCLQDLVSIEKKCVVCTENCLSYLMTAVLKVQWYYINIPNLSSSWTTSNCFHLFALQENAGEKLRHFPLCVRVWVKAWTASKNKEFRLLKRVNNSY